MAGHTNAVENLAADLGSEVYVLAPDDGRYFLGEAAMVGVAAVLVSAFLRGLSAGAESKLEAWGRSCGEWLTARVAALARDAAGTDAQEELASEARDAAESGAEEYREAVVLVLEQVLAARGMTQTEATETAAKVAVAADAVLAATSGS